MIYDVSYRFTAIILGIRIRDSYIHFKKGTVEIRWDDALRTMVWQETKSCRFLKVWGYDAYMKKFQPDKLEPKLEKCVFIEYPKETVGYTFYHRSEGKIFVAKNGSFLEKEFLSK